MQKLSKWGKIRYLDQLKNRVPTSGGDPILQLIASGDPILQLIQMCENSDPILHMGGQTTIKNLSFW